MIKNERQYAVAKAHIKQFERAIDEMTEVSPEEAGLHPLQLKARLDAAQSEVEVLVRRIQAYDALRYATPVALTLDSFEELPRALIRARIASGLTQKDLAERLEIKEQQIQRYEATDYASASLGRLMEVAKVLGVDIREEIILGGKLKVKELLLRLQKVGFTKAFILGRLVSADLRDQVHDVLSGGETEEPDLVAKVASSVARTFGWASAALLGPRLPALSPMAVYTARFKTPRNTSEEKVTAYAVYAHVLALLTLEATKKIHQKKAPTDPIVLHNEIRERSGEVTFETALCYVWSLGVPVLPLNDRSSFHGACWRADGRNIIVLKQQTTSPSRWLHDLLHELKHTTDNVDEPEFAVIEATPIGYDRRESEDEKNADNYAVEATFGGKASQLAEQCVKAARGSIEQLKQAVQHISVKEHVDTGSLANYLAHRLQTQNNHNWWGSAQKLQRSDFSPWSYARDMFLQNVELSVLNDFDRNLLMRALTDPVEVDELGDTRDYG